MNVKYLKTIMDEELNRDQYPIDVELFVTRLYGKLLEITRKETCGDEVKVEKKEENKKVQFKERHSRAGRAYAATVASGIYGKFTCPNCGTENIKNMPRQFSCSKKQNIMCARYRTVKSAYELKNKTPYFHTYQQYVEKYGYRYIESERKINTTNNSVQI